MCGRRKGSRSLFVLSLIYDKLRKSRLTWLSLLGLALLALTVFRRLWSAAQSPELLSLQSRRAQRLMTAVPQPLQPQEPAGVAILFETYSGIETGSLWTRWFQDAYNFLQDSTEDPFNESPHLRAFVQYMHLYELEDIKQYVPPDFQSRLLRHPGKCFYRSTNACALALYREALTTMPTAQFFILVSHNTIPLKPFSQLWSSLKKDARSRWAFNTLIWNNKYTSPKTSNWRILNRHDVSYLASHPEDCRDYPLIDHVGSDEYWLLHALLKEFGEQYLNNVNCFTWHSEFQSRQIPPDICSDAAPTFECWRNCHEYGHVSGGPRPPASFDSFHQERLDGLLRDPEYLFARKFTDNTTLIEDGTVFLRDYIADFHKFNSTRYVWTPANPLPSFEYPAMKDVESVKELEKVLMRVHPSKRSPRLRKSADE